MKKLMTGLLMASALTPVAALAADQLAQSRLERLEEIVVTAEKAKPADYKVDKATAALLAEIEAAK
jgi:hypothetical protein